MLLGWLRELVQGLRREISLERQQPEEPRSDSQVVEVFDDADETTYVPIATFRNVQGAEEFRQRLAAEGIDSVVWPPDAGGVAVGVSIDEDEVATEYPQHWYSVPAGFPENGVCPACSRRVVERGDEPGFEWRCLACGQVWGARGIRRP